jgi:hypothetical protein
VCSHPHVRQPTSTQHAPPARGITSGAYRAGDVGHVTVVLRAHVQQRLRSYHRINQLINKLYATPNPRTVMDTLLCGYSRYCLYTPRGSHRFDGVHSTDTGSQEVWKHCIRTRQPDTRPKLITSFSQNQQRSHGRMLQPKPRHCALR